jgi:hypothetical protein
MEYDLESVKKKRSLSLKACTFCKKRHLRCDGSHPCTQCISRNEECVFVISCKRGRKKHSTTPIMVCTKSQFDLLTNSQSLLTSRFRDLSFTPLYHIIISHTWQRFRKQCNHYSPNLLQRRFSWLHLQSHCESPIPKSWRFSKT